MDELFENLIFEALKDKATDLHFKLDEKQLTISLRIYGELTFFKSFDRSLGAKLMNYLKYRSMINVNYKMQPQTGAFHYELDHHTYFLRVSYLPGLRFESIVIRILNNHEGITIEKLSDIPTFTSFLENICEKRQGLFLVAGATGSGKSTSLYSILDRIIEEGGRNIVTLEDPIEMIKEHCLQIEMHEDMGINYYSSLKQILRHDPDVIMIGEIRDAKTAQLAITCALTGHLVLSTIHASTAPLVLKRMLNLGVSDTDLEDVCVGIVAQRIKYDKVHGKVIVLPEILTKKEIRAFLHEQYVDYANFKKHALYLIEEKHFDAKLFAEELEDE
jgi:competence protein ComGA